MVNLAINTHLGPGATDHPCRWMTSLLLDGIRRSMEDSLILQDYQGMTSFFYTFSYLMGQYQSYHIWVWTSIDPTFWDEHRDTTVTTVFIHTSDIVETCQIEAWWSKPNFHSFSCIFRSRFHSCTVVKSWCCFLVTNEATHQATFVKLPVMGWKVNCITTLWFSKFQGTFSPNEDNIYI